MIIQFFILWGLATIQRKTNKPWLSAIIYTIIAIAFYWISGELTIDTNYEAEFVSAEIVGNILGISIIYFPISLLYFWLLEKFEDSGWYWVIFFALPAPFFIIWFLQM